MHWKNIINFARETLRQRTFVEILEAELREATIAKLQAETSLEYAQSMVDYNRNRVNRLQVRLTEMKGTE